MYYYILGCGIACLVLFGIYRRVCGCCDREIIMKER